MRNWDKEDLCVAAVGGFTALLVLFLVVVLCEAVYWKAPTYGEAQVIDLHYAPSSSETGVGTTYVPQPNGSIVPVTTTTTESRSEKWTVMLSDGRDVFSAAAAPKVFYSLQKGQTTRYVAWRGRLTGISYGLTVE